MDRLPKEGEKRGPTPVSRRAEKPGQALNVDLCFVPAHHEGEVRLPAVSGSSGRLVVQKPKAHQDEVSYPGQVFAKEGLDYACAMREFVAESEARSENSSEKGRAAKAEKAALVARKQAFKQEEEALRAARRQVRQRRRQEDGAWQILKAQRREQHQASKAQKQANPTPSKGTQKAEADHWQHLRRGRQAQVEARKQEDPVWREKRQDLRRRAEEVMARPLASSWIAILVLIDNCTRQCLGLPLFVAGQHLTAQMVVAALRALLPKHLEFLISDRGVHFTAEVFRQLAKEEHFIHVLIARHRPQSNGIAERFIRTFKEWLIDKSWQSHPELTQILDQFQTEYNDRPHQGLPMPGVSPNEFANRIINAIDD